jgi:hypothetical protein
MDEDREKSSDMLLECDEASLLDKLDESTRFTFLKCLLHSATILTKTMRKKEDLEPYVLVLSISRMGDRKPKIVAGWTTTTKHA